MLFLRIEEKCNLERTVTENGELINLPLTKAFLDNGEVVRVLDNDTKDLGLILVLLLGHV